MEEPIYLDSGTLSPPSSYLINEMQPYLKRHWHSLSAPYLKGKEPFTSIDRSTQDIRSLVGAHEKDHFVFTPTPISMVYYSVYFDHLSSSGKNHILTTPNESPTLYALGKQLEKGGVFQKTVPLNANGQLTRENLEKALSPKTGFVSLAWANPLSGVIHPIWELAELCREREVLFHVDASSSLGKLYFKFEELPIDFLTFEGPKLHGPKGSGGVFVRRGLEFTSPEEGELNTAALIGTGIAFEQLASSFDHLCMETARLRDRLETGITTTLKEAKVLFSEAERLPNVSAIDFPGIKNELLLFHLREGGVFAAQMEESSALSFALSREATEEEIDRAIGIIVDAAQRCRTFSQEVFA